MLGRVGVAAPDDIPVLRLMGTIVNECVLQLRRTEWPSHHSVILIFRLELGMAEGGDRGLTDADAAVIRWDRTVHQYLETLGAQT